MPLLEYAYNNTIHTSTRKAPFEIIKGRPKLPLIVKMLGHVFAAVNIFEILRNLFKRLKILYPSRKRDKMLLRISTKEIWSSKRMIGCYLSSLKHALGILRVRRLMGVQRVTKSTMLN